MKLWTVRMVEEKRGRVENLASVRAIWIREADYIRAERLRTLRSSSQSIRLAFRIWTTYLTFSSSTSTSTFSSSFFFFFFFLYFCSSSSFSFLFYPLISFHPIVSSTLIRHFREIVLEYFFSHSFQTTLVLSIDDHSKRLKENKEKKKEKKRRNDRKSFFRNDSNVRFIFIGKWKLFWITSLDFIVAL